MNNDKTPPITSKRALPNVYLFKTLPPTPKKSVLAQKSPQHDQIFYLLKTPPLTSKKTVPNCEFIQNAPPTSKKAVTTTRSP